MSTVGDASSTKAPLLPSGSRYALGDEIARGGMGEVYRATDTVLGREVAVKVLQPKYHPDSSTARRFRDEARIAAQLQHPGIPAVHDLGTLPDGRPFLAMKLIKGHTLDDLLKCRPSPSDDRGRFVAIFEQIAHALAYAHAHGVIHRDLKPANVMVGAFHETQVMDWGLAKVLASRGRQSPGSSDDPDATVDPDPTEIQSLRDSDDLRTQAGSILGTPAFMAPEQAVGAVDKIDRRTDVFGLGAILAVVLTGAPPYSGGSMETTRVKAAQGDVDDCFARLDGCGAEPELVTLCKRCLNPKTAARPADAEEVATIVAALRAAAAERARSAEIDREKATVQAAEQRKRRRVQLALAVAVGLLAVGGGLVGWWADANRRDREGDQLRVASERATEQAVAEATERQAITSALDQAEAALRADKFADADAALEQARRRMPNSGFDELSSRLGDLNRDRQLVRQLDGLRFGWVTYGELQEQYFDNEPTPGQKPVWAPKDVLPRVFREAGWDLTDPASETLGQRVLSSPIRGWLVAVLEKCAVQADFALGDAVWVEKILVALRIADPDPVRTRLRAAVASGKVTRKDRDLIRDIDPAAHPADFLYTVCLNSGNANNGSLRRQALVHHPSHIGLLTILDSTVSAETFYAGTMAALALRPDSSPLRATQSSNLLAMGDVDGAVQSARVLVQKAPQYGRGYERLVEALLRRDAVREAEAVCEQGRQCKGPLGRHFVSDAAALVAGWYEGRQDSEQALRWLQRSFESYPSSHLLPRLEVAAIAHKKPIDVTEWAVRLAERHPLPDEIFLALGDYYQNKNPERAAELYRRMSRPAVGSGSWRRREEENKRVATLIAKNDLATALKLVRQIHADELEAAERAPADQPVVDSGYWSRTATFLDLLFRTGDREGALRLADRIVKDLEDGSKKYVYDGTSVVTVGDHLVREREPELAGRVYRAAIQAGTRSDGRSTTTWAVGKYRAVLVQLRRPADGVKVLEEFIVAQPHLAETPFAKLRYHAACLAVLAGTPEARAKALAWLRADLDDWEDLLRRNQAPPTSVLEYCRQVTGERELAGVREPDRVAKMSAGERAGWEEYWNRVRVQSQQLGPAAEYELLKSRAKSPAEWEEVIAKAPPSEKAWAHFNHGAALDRAGKQDEAEAAFDRGLALREQDAKGGGLASQTQLGIYLIDRGLIYLRSNRHELSIRWMTRAVEFYMAYSDKWPGVEATLRLRWSHTNRAISHDALGNHTDALADWRKAALFSKPGERRFVRVSLALSLRRCGKFAEAVAEVADLCSKSDQWSGVDLYTFAVIYAWGSEKIADKKKEYADAAMEMLHQAVKAGWKDATHLKKDTDFDPLRDRADFKKLVTDLEAKDPPRKETLPPPQVDK